MKTSLTLAIALIFHLSSLIFAAPSRKLFSPARLEGGIVQIGESVVVASSTSVNGSVVVLAGGAKIQGPVEEDVVVVGGPVSIDSEVKGSVFVMGRTLSLGAHSIIDGDLTTLGARLEEEPGAVVRGQRVTLGGLKFGVIGALAAMAALFAAFLFWLKVFASVGWLVLAVLLAALFPAALEDSSEYLSERPVWSLAAGLLVLPGALLVSAALLVTLIGIALLPLLGVFLAGLGVWGYLTVAYWIGDRLFRGVRMYVQGWLSCLLGITVIQVIRWTPLIGLWATALFFVFGVGAALLSFLNACMRWRMRPVHVNP